MKKLILSSVFFVTALPCFAQIAVIVHPSNVNTLSSEHIEKIFLGKEKSFPDGSKVVPVALNENLPSTDVFNQKVLNKSASQLKAYWSKLIFTGRGQPPQEMDNTDEMLELVANNPNLIGYIDEALVTDKVKVVGSF